MNERKNIERIFQEKFKDFEVNPAEEVWGNIEKKLDEKKRRRIIPFWWKLSGVAAVFFIGFFVSKSFFIAPNSTENPTVTDINSNQQKTTKTNPISVEKLRESNSNTSSSTDAVVTNSSEKNSAGKNLRESNSNNSSSSDAVVSNSKEKKDNTENSTKPNFIPNTSNNAIAGGKFEKQNSNKNKSNGKNTKSLIDEKMIYKSENEIAINKENESGLSSIKDTKSVSNLDEKAKQIIPSEGVVNNSKNIKLDELKNNNSITATTEVEKKTNDSVIKNSVVTNALEELLNEKESKTKQEAKVNRWQLTSNVATIFLGSTSNGSAIDPELNNNSKTYNTSVGFGLGVSYNATSKLSVRTGLNKVNMSYNTNDIMFFASIESRGLKNVSPTRSSAMMEIHSMVSSNNSVGSTSENGMLPFESALVQQNTGYLNQEIGYLEMPLEMTYALIDKKFGLKVIGGFSTLLLQENAITVVSDNNSMLLGEANNLNNIHFSTNLGIGIKYGFMKSFEFNVEPMVKYQLNTFSTNGGDFKPYFFGIYSGVSYRF
jgi:hypothetical protein